MTSTAEEDVVDNAYTSVNMGLEDDVSLKNVELKDMSEGKTEEANGVHPAKIEQSNHVSSSKTDSGAASSGSKPFLPKIFIALLIVLLIAVIALCFVLYHLDQEMDKANSATEIVKQKRETDKKELSDMKEAFKSEILQLKNKSILVDKERGDLLQKINVLQSKIETIPSDINKTLEIKDQEIEDVKYFTYQLKMFVQMTDERFKPLKLTFKEILEYAGITDKITPANPLLAKLRDQLDTFNKDYKKKWDITYDDILRLMDNSDFIKGKPLPLLSKIDALCKLFEKDYKEKWGIVFKDVIRLSTKTDLPTGMLIDGYGYASIPLVLRKIEHLYQLFIKKYNKDWNIKFPDVIKLTEDVSFPEDATDIPALKKVGEYYVKGFQGVWGDSFEEFLHLVLDMNETEGKDLVKKMTALTSDVKLKFLPAKFEYKDNKLTISGYVEINMDDRWGTISKNKGYFKDHEADLVCKYSGYSSGRFDGGIYGKGGTDRSSLPFLVKSLRCFDEVTDIAECMKTLVPNTMRALDDTYEVAPKANDALVSTAAPSKTPASKAATKAATKAPTTAPATIATKAITTLKPSTAAPTTGAVTQPPTQPPSQPPTKPPTQPPTQPTTQPPTTKAPTEPPTTKAPTEPPTTKAPTKPPTTLPPPWDHKDDVAVLCVL